MNSKEKDTIRIIEHEVNRLTDIFASNPKETKQINPRAWELLLIYAPHEEIEKRLAKTVRNAQQVPRIGATLKWTTLGGKTYEGVIIEIDSNVAIVRLPDGTEKAVEL